MRYCSERHFFLFDEGNKAIELLNNLEDSFDYTKVLNEFRGIFNRNFNDFSSKIFEIIRSHINKLNLTAHTRNKSINIGHVKNICNGIFINDDVKNILFHINSILSCMTFKNKFDIKLCINLIDFLEEIDILCMVEIYLYLLNEDLDSVLAFILGKINDSVIYKNDVSVQAVNEKFLRDVEHKLGLFNKLYEDENISLVTKNRDHLIYKINDVIKIIQLTK